VSETQDLQDWLRSYGHVSAEDREAMQARVFKELIYLIEQAKDLFGYEAVYFGVSTAGDKSPQLVAGMLPAVCRSMRRKHPQPYGY
jgi:hypothetical protein